jgi:hypothetical protein
LEAEVQAGLGPKDEITSLQSAITPEFAKGLVSLQELIMKQDPYFLSESSKQSPRRHLQTFAKVAQLSIAKGVLHQNRIRRLMNINNKAKVRCFMKLGTAEM